MTAGFKLYCFDLDGTLIRNHLTDGPEGRPVPVDEGFDYIEVLPKVVGKLMELVGHEKHLAVVTNQGGVATGWQTEKQVWDKAARAWGQLTLHLFGPRASFHVAFDYPKADEPWKSMPERRKPSPNMLLEAMTLHSALPEETIFVGDLPTDKEAATAAGVAWQHPQEFFGWDRDYSGGA